MNYLIKQGKVAPPRAGRNYEWHLEHIDQAAAKFDEQEAYTLEANVLMYHGVDAEQFLVLTFMSLSSRRRSLVTSPASPGST